VIPYVPLGAVSKPEKLSVHWRPFDGSGLYFSLDYWGDPSTGFVHVEVYRERNRGTPDIEQFLIADYQQPYWPASYEELYSFYKERVVTGAVPMLTDATGAVSPRLVSDPGPPSYLPDLTPATVQTAADWERQLVYVSPTPVATSGKSPMSVAAAASVPAVASAESVNLGKVVLPLIIVGALLFAMRNW